MLAAVDREVNTTVGDYDIDLVLRSTASASTSTAAPSRLGPGLALPGHCSAAEGIDCSQTTPGPDSTAQG